MATPDEAARTPGRRREEAFRTAQGSPTNRKTATTQTADSNPARSELGKALSIVKFNFLLLLRGQEETATGWVSGSAEPPRPAHTHREAKKQARRAGTRRRQRSCLLGGDRRRAGETKGKGPKDGRDKGPRRERPSNGPMRRRTNVATDGAPRHHEGQDTFAPPSVADPSQGGRSGRSSGDAGRNNADKPSTRPRARSAWAAAQTQPTSKKSIMLSQKKKKRRPTFVERLKKNGGRLRFSSPAGDQPRSGAKEEKGASSAGPPTSARAAPRRRLRPTGTRRGQPENSGPWDAAGRRTRTPRANTATATRGRKDRPETTQGQNTANRQDPTRGQRRESSGNAARRRGKSCRLLVGYQYQRGRVEKARKQR